MGDAGEQVLLQGPGSAVWDRQQVRHLGAC